MITATYSPEDNKLRLYASTRLDSETYTRVKNAGFRWAPKQQLFVAPKWTPERAALCEELACEIGDEDTSLVERAEERAERFDEYSEKRAADSERAAAAVRQIADGIPLGQPILVGHHSERHARKDAERIENGMRKAVKMWETSKYWTARAAGALRAAKYKELPGVRARRIKGIEADVRKCERNIADSEQSIRLIEKIQTATLKRTDGTELTYAERVHLLAGRSNAFGYSMYADLEAGRVTPEDACANALASARRCIEINRQWIAHNSNRLAYERAMLEEQRASELLVRKAPPKKLPLCNYRAPHGLDIPNQYNCGEMIHYPQAEMTQAEYAAINQDYKGTRVVGNSHRVRTAYTHTAAHGRALVCVFLTDSKTHEPPAPRDPAPRVERPREYVHDEPRPAAVEKPADIEAIKESLRAGVTVAAVPQLFPTPPDIAARMIEEAEIEPGNTVMEPSAGTGNILTAIMNDNKARAVVAIEINKQLADRLKSEYELTNVICADFLQYERAPWTVDRILMNPPFGNGADIQHIEHARKFLKPGGRLVAICADGPRQREKLGPIAHSWESLPPGSFKDQGTMVNTALIVING